MKIKSIPDKMPYVNLLTLRDLIRSYEEIENKIDDKSPCTFAYDLGRLAVFELFFRLLGVQFDAGDEA